MSNDRIFSHFAEEFVKAAQLIFESTSTVPKEELPDLTLEECASFDVRRDKLKMAIKYLTVQQPDKSDVEKLSTFFKTIYKVEDDQIKFRHHYSDICEIIFSDLTPGIDGIPAGITMLSTSIELVKKHIEQVEDEDGSCSYCIRCLDKLIDHVDLESVRLDYMLRQYSESHKELEKEREQLQSKIDDTDKRYEELREKYSSAQKEYIAILGIFAAVVMAVVGGMAFSTGSFSAIAEAPIQSLAALACIVGVVLIDVVYAVFRFIWNMTKTSFEEDAVPLSMSTLIALNMTLAAFAFVLIAWLYSMPVN